MKLITAAIVIGFCLIAITPAPLTASLQERKGSCSMTDHSSNQGRMTCCHMSGAGVHSCPCNNIPRAATPIPQSACGCSSMMTTIAQPATLLERLRRYAVGGYRRVTGKNLLEHESRREIYEKIVATPGIDLKTLIQLTGVNENTLRYHIERMESGGKIQTTNIGGVSHFFENHGRYSEEEQILKARMFTSGTGKILHMILHHPGITRGELADNLGVAGPTVTRCMTHLIGEGLIRQQRDGRFTRYYPDGLMTKDVSIQVQTGSPAYYFPGTTLQSSAG